MNEMNDRNLLREFYDGGSEEPLAELLRRYLPLVYSVALRQTHGDSLLAQEIAQETFCVLARKAGQISDDAVLSGWLCRTAFHLAQKAVRAEMRRHRREQDAYFMQIPSSISESEDLCQDISGVGSDLDAAMDDLPEADRLVLILRYFQKMRMRHLGEALGVSEEAARMRVSRALQRLRDLLVKRGFPISAAALLVFMEEKSIAAIPAGVVEQMQAGLRVEYSRLRNRTTARSYGGSGNLTKMAALVGALSIVPLLWIAKKNHEALNTRPATPEISLVPVTGSPRTKLAARTPPFDYEAAAAILRKALKDPWPSEIVPFQRVEDALALYGRHRAAATPVLMEMLLGLRSEHKTESMILAVHGLQVLGPDAAQALEDLLILHESGDLAFLSEREKDLFAAIDISGTTLPKFMKELVGFGVADSIVIELLRRNPGVAPMYRDELLKWLRNSPPHWDHAAIILAQVPELYDPGVIPELTRHLKKVQDGTDDPDARAWAFGTIEAARELGAKELIEPLIELARTESVTGEVRDAAFSAIVAIDLTAIGNLDDVRSWRMEHEEGLRLAEKARNNEAAYVDLLAGLHHRESASAAAQRLKTNGGDLPAADLLHAAEKFGDPSVISCLELVPLSDFVTQLRKGNVEGIAQVTCIFGNLPPEHEAIAALDDAFDRINQQTEAGLRTATAVLNASRNNYRVQNGMMFLDELAVESLRTSLMELWRSAPGAQNETARLLNYLNGKTYARRSVCLQMLNEITERPELRQALISQAAFPMIQHFLPIAALKSVDGKVAGNSGLR